MREEKNVQLATDNTLFIRQKKLHRGNNFGVSTVFEAFKLRVEKT